MTQTLRDPLRSVRPEDVTHLGLALARYLPAADPAQKNAAKDALVTALVNRFREHARRPSGRVPGEPPPAGSGRHRQRTARARS